MEEEQEQEELVETESGLAASIAIDVGLNGDIDVNFAWDDSDMGNSVYLGKLLFALTNGYLDELLQNRLNKEVLEDSNNEKFVNKSLRIWEAELIREKVENRSPYVPSFKVFNVGRN